MSDERYCGCPYCEAIFKLPENKFKHRQGIVRCGACREVFDSGRNLLVRSNGNFVPVTTIYPVVESRNTSVSAPALNKSDDELSGKSNPFDSEMAITRYPEDALENTVPAGQSDSNSLGFKVTRNLHTDDIKNPFDDISQPSLSISRDDEPLVKKADKISENADLIKSEPKFTPLNLDQDDSEQFSESDSDSVPHRIETKLSGYSECTTYIDDFDSELNLNLVTAGVTPEHDSKLSANSETDITFMDESQFSGMRREEVDKYIKERRNPLIGFVWFSVVAVFLFLLSLQVKFFFVEKYAQHDQYRSYLSLFCQVAGCELPPKRDPFKFTLTHTKIDLHPTQPDAIRVTVKLINEAKFAQPYPDLQLTLTDRVGRVVGRRTFPPNLYLSENLDQLLGKGELASILFDLSRPHEKAVGFVIDIVNSTES